jgi:hypothetical protein
MFRILLVVGATLISSSSYAYEVFKKNGEIEELCDYHDYKSNCVKTEFWIGKETEIRFGIHYQGWFENGVVIVGGMREVINTLSRPVEASYHLALYDQNKNLIASQSEHFEFKAKEKDTLSQEPMFVPKELIEKISSYEIVVYFQ